MLGEVTGSNGRLPLNLLKILVGSQTPISIDDLTAFWAVTPCLDWAWVDAGVEHTAQAETMRSILLATVIGSGVSM